MIKVVFTGVESTGKSTFAQLLAEKYGGSLVGEYARDFLSSKDGEYNETDLLVILQGQYDLEATARLCFPKLLVCDTGPLVIKVWSMFKYKHVHDSILKSLDSYKADLFVLLDPTDVPFEPDPLRENAENRMELFEIYKNELANLSNPYLVLSGRKEDRIRELFDKVDSLLSDGKS